PKGGYYDKGISREEYVVSDSRKGAKTRRLCCIWIYPSPERSRRAVIMIREFLERNPWRCLFATRRHTNTMVTFVNKAISPFQGYYPSAKLELPLFRILAKRSK